MNRINMIIFFILYILSKINLIYIMSILLSCQIFFLRVNYYGFFTFDILYLFHLKLASLVKIFWLVEF